MKRRWLLWLLVIMFVWMVIGRLTEIEKLALAFSQGKWQWVLGAAVLAVFYYVLNAALYQAAFDTAGVESSVSGLLPVVFASVFVNLIAPGGGAALFVDDAARRGQSGARATAGTLLSIAAEFGTFALVLAVGLFYLFVQHDLRVYEIVAAAVLLVLVSGLSGVLLLGLWRPDRLERLLEWLQRLVNRLAASFRHAAVLAEDWADRNTAEFSEAGMAIRAHPTGLGRALALALAAHLVDLASLYALFQAFRQPVGFGVLVAGYAVGVLFWIMSITPQGVGVVEGVMALVYTSLGVPTAHSTLIALAYRGLSFWLPMAIGFLLVRRVKSFDAEPGRSTGASSVHVVALLTALMGLVNVLSGLTPALADRLALLRRLVPIEARHGAHLAAVLTGFALLMLSRSLWRRKRVAWLLATLLLSISAVSHVVKGLDYEEAILSAALLAWLWSLRAQFHARSDPWSVSQGLRALVAALSFSLAYGVAGFYLLDRHFQVRFGFSAAVRQTIVMLTQVYDPGLQPITGFGRYFAASIYLVAAVTLAYALLMLLRPVLVRQPASLVERARAKAIVEAHGRSSLARFVLLNDKSYFFSPGESVLAYVVKGRIALVLGDPIGPQQDASAAINGFRERCTRNDWQLAFYQTLPDYLDHYRAAGLVYVCIGHEAIVELASFQLSGGENKGLRSAVHKLTTLGYRTELHTPPWPDELLRELRAVSDEWLAMVKGTEKRFSLGWFEDDYIRNSPAMVVHDPNGRVVAFANIVPEYQLAEGTIDLMRHRRGVEHGTMEFLFVALFEWAKQQGYSTFNLGLSGLAGVGENAGDPGLERAMHYIYEHVSQFYDFKGLYQFKAKFHPTWSPRYLVYPGSASLPSVVMALIRADSGDHFVGRHVRRSNAGRHVRLARA